MRGLGQAFSQWWGQRALSLRCSLRGSQARTALTNSRSWMSASRRFRALLEAMLHVAACGVSARTRTVASAEQRHTQRAAPAGGSELCAEQGNSVLA
jgi:intracellular sulfur oxidation DsrE/DsrF family protein